MEEKLLYGIAYVCEMSLVCQSMWYDYDVLYTKRTLAYINGSMNKIRRHND